MHVRAVSVFLVQPPGEPGTTMDDAGQRRQGLWFLRTLLVKIARNGGEEFAVSSQCIDVFAQGLKLSVWISQHCKDGLAPAGQGDTNVATDKPG